MVPVPNGNEYLETAVYSASPAKLRLMTLELAVQKAGEALELARTEGSVRASEHTVTLRDCLDELLSGIAPSEDDLSHKVADLYVFMLQWLTVAEQKGDLKMLEDIKRVLDIERDTWREVAQAAASAAAPTATSAPLVSFDSESSESFSLDA